MNFNLRLAQFVEPNLLWRVILNDKHSTVWDGQQTLFEFNFLALGISADECFEMADLVHLKPGKERQVGFPLGHSCVAK